jgi:DNA-binding HxlR family transcriptional regulator
MWRSRSTHSVLDPQCPSRVVLDRIADKWTALIIQVLARGTMRYAALRREIGGISQKMLTQTLRSLERDGLVQRKVHPVIPPRVDYALTRLGRTLIEPLQGLCRWSEKHLPELQANRARAALKMPPNSAGRTLAGVNSGRSPRVTA